MKNDIIINGISPSFPLYTNNWKELSVMEELEIPEQKLDMQRLISLNIESEITKVEIVKTPVTAANPEGYWNTGYKAIVKGMLHQIIEYIDCSCSQASHSAHYDVPFCAYIVLGDYKPGDCVEVKSIVEDVYIKQLDCRRFFKNVTLFVYAEVTNQSEAGVVAVLTEASETKGVTVENEGFNKYTVRAKDSMLPFDVNVITEPTNPLKQFSPSTLPAEYTWTPNQYETAGKVDVLENATDLTTRYAADVGKFEKIATVDFVIEPDLKASPLTAGMTVEQKGNDFSVKVPYGTEASLELTTTPESPVENSKIDTGLSYEDNKTKTGGTLTVDPSDGTSPYTAEFVVGEEEAKSRFTSIIDVTVLEPVPKVEANPQFETATGTAPLIEKVSNTEYVAKIDTVSLPATFDSPVVNISSDSKAPVRRVTALPEGYAIAPGKDITISTVQITEKAQLTPVTLEFDIGENGAVARTKVSFEYFNSKDDAGMVESERVVVEEVSKL